MTFGKRLSFYMASVCPEVRWVDADVRLHQDVDNESNGSPQRESTRDPELHSANKLKGRETRTAPKEKPKVSPPAKPLASLRCEEAIRWLLCCLAR